MKFYYLCNLKQLFMRKVTAMGETILDIIFRNMHPVAAVPGGSSFNSIISVGRTGIPCRFIGYTGGDKPGTQTMEFLQENGVDTTYFEQRSDEKSAISLAYINEQGDAEYVFYKPEPTAGAMQNAPTFERGDVLLYGSYYACCNGLRPQVTDILTRATEGGATVYYDINFRASHRHEREDLLPVIEWNMQHSTIVRGSADDFEILFDSRDAENIYRQHIAPYCSLFLCTGGAGCITICTPTGIHTFQAPRIDDVVSTVGAGDNFNAGLICAMYRAGLDCDAMQSLSLADWQSLVDVACSYAGEACRSTNNYVSREFALKWQK